MQKHPKKYVPSVSFSLCFWYSAAARPKKLKANEQMKAATVSRQSIPTRQRRRMKKWKAKQVHRR